MKNAGVPGLPHSGDISLLAPPPTVTPTPPWEGRAIATHKLRLVEFSAFIEQERAPDTVNTIFLDISCFVDCFLVSSILMINWKDDTFRRCISFYSSPLPTV
jgi:hypothetical protein